MAMYCLYGVGIPTERSYYYLNLASEEVRQLSWAPRSSLTTLRYLGMSCGAAKRGERAEARRAGSPSRDVKLMSLHNIAPWLGRGGVRHGMHC